MPAKGDRPAGRFFARAAGRPGVGETTVTPTEPSWPQHSRCGGECVPEGAADYGRKANGTSCRQHRQRVFKASYTSHYRTGLIQVIEVLEFGSASTVHAPMVEALALINRYKADVPGRVKCYAPGEHVPVGGIIPAGLAELMYQGDGKRRRILRTVYGCGVFQALREKLRCKEIWVAGAEKWRNPDLDLPADVEDRRAENCAQLRKRWTPGGSPAPMREELAAGLGALSDAPGGKAWPG